MTHILALIPARGGSKGIPRKNIRPFAGFPLIAWSIAAAKQSDLVTRVIVSTDDEEIAAVAREFGAETPFLRPPKFAEDNTTDLPVFEQPCSGWPNTKTINLKSLCNCAPPHRSARAGWWTMRYVSCSITPMPTACAAWSRPGRTRTRCGVSAVNMDR